MAAEFPIYVETIVSGYSYQAPAEGTTAVSRSNPARPEEVWNQYADVPDTPDGGLLNDGDTAGVVALRKRKALSSVTGSTTLYEIGAAPESLSFVIPERLSGDCGPTLRTPPEPAGGYGPVIEDATGGTHALDPAVWRIDGLDHIVEFVGGVPPDMPQPLSVTFFQYTGAYGGESSDPPPTLWERAAGVVRPNGAYPVAGTDTVVFPSSSGEGPSARMMIDGTTGAVRGGEATGGQWDAASRGAHSVAFGLDTVASGARSVSLGETNSATAAGSAILGGGSNTAAGASSVVCGGSGNSAAGDHSWAGGNGSVVAAGHSGALVWSDGTPRASTGADEVTFGAAGGFRVLAGGGGGLPFTAGDVYLDSGTVSATGDLAVGGVAEISSGATIAERPAAPVAPVAGKGTLWVKNDAPCVPTFTDDGGTDHTLRYGDTSEAWEYSGGALRPDALKAGYNAAASWVFGSQSLDDTGASGEYRALYDKSSGSFRAGSVTGPGWDAASRGDHSVAFGRGGVASGAFSGVGGGDGNSATGAYSWACGGETNTAAGDHSWAGGGRVFDRRPTQRFFCMV